MQLIAQAEPRLVPRDIGSNPIKLLHENVAQLAEHEGGSLECIGSSPIVFTFYEGVFQLGDGARL